VLWSILSPFCPLFRVVSDPVSVSQLLPLGDDDDRLAESTVLLMKLVTDEGRGPASELASS
jgi:hypothetical protein